MTWWEWLVAWWVASAITVALLFFITERYDWANHNNCHWNWDKLPFVITRPIVLFCLPGALTLLAGAILLQETLYRQKEREDS